MENRDTEHILNSLDGLQKASPGPFFYTRVQARLQKRRNWFLGSSVRLYYPTRGSTGDPGSYLSFECGGVFL